MCWQDGDWEGEDLVSSMVSKLQAVWHDRISMETETTDDAEVHCWVTDAKDVALFRKDGRTRQLHPSNIFWRVEAFLVRY